jgi:hypothetical protein
LPNRVANCKSIIKASNKELKQKFLVSYKESNKNGKKKRIKVREKGDSEFGNHLADSASELNLTTTTTE